MISVVTKFGELILEKDTEFGLTSAVSDFGKLETRQGITSNSFSIPRTAGNMKTLGFSDVSQSENPINPYKKIECKLYKNQNFIAKGYVQITSYNAKSLELDFFGGNTEWYKEIGNLKINELRSLQNYIHIWNSANVVAYSNPQVTNFAFFYPIISNGKQLFRGAIQFEDKELYPAFFVKKLLELVFQSFGYTLGGDFYNSTIFAKLFLPYANSGEPKIQEDEVERRKFKEFKNIVFQETFSGGTFSRVINLRVFSGDIVQTGDFNGIGYVCFYDVYKIILNNFLILFSGGSEIPITNTRIRVTTNDGVITEPLVNKLGNLKGKTILAIDILFDITIISSVDVTISTTGTEIYPDLVGGELWNRYINPAWFLPNLTFAELLRTLANQFGLYFYTDFFSKKVFIRTLQNTIKNKKNALDYTNKINALDNEIDFYKVIEKYFKKSIFKYKKPEEDSFVATYNVDFSHKKEFASAEIFIENDFIEQEGIIFESAFSPTACGKVFNNTTYLPTISIFDNGGNPKTPNPRMLILGESIPFSQISTSPSYAIQGQGSFSSLFFCYFVKKDVAKNDFQNLNFGNLDDGTQFGFSLQDTYLKDLIRILQKPFLLKAKFLISEADFLNFDFSKLIYLGEPYFAYFFVNKIVEFGNDDLTEFELIKV